MRSSGPVSHFSSGFSCCPPSRAGPLDGRYTVDADPGCTVRIATDANGDLLLTAEQPGSIDMPRNPSLEPKMALMIGRFFNGRFLLQRDSGKYQRMLDGADYYLVLAPAANGVRVTWVQFPNPALFVRGYRKDMKLVRAAASGPPSLAQDLADASGTRAIHAAVVRKGSDVDELVELLTTAGGCERAQRKGRAAPHAFQRHQCPWILRRAGAKKTLDD